MRWGEGEMRAEGRREGQTDEGWRDGEDRLVTNMYLGVASVKLFIIFMVGQYGGRENDSFIQLFKSRQISSMDSSSFQSYRSTFPSKRNFCPNFCPPNGGSHLFCVRCYLFLANYNGSSSVFFLPVSRNRNIFDDDNLFPPLNQSIN